MKKLGLVLMAVTLGVLLTVPAFALGSREGKGFGGGKDDGYCAQAGLSKLNLSDEQKKKMEALQTAHLKDVRPLREKMFDKEQKAVNLT